MPVIKCNSVDDTRLEPYRGLISRPKGDGLQDFVVEGRLLVSRLMSSRFELTSVLTMRNQLPTAEKIVGTEVPIYLLEKSQLCELVGFPFHRGLLACGKRCPMATLDQILAIPPLTPQTIVVCPAIHDDMNVGSILRIIAAFGGNGLILGPNCPDAFSRKTLRVSMGAALQLPIRVASDIAAELEWLRDAAGFHLMATDLDMQSCPIKTVTAPERLAILLGAEDTGLIHQHRALCDSTVTIPMQPGTDSLNVAVALGIVMHQLRG